MEGNVGWTTAGRVPSRRGWDGLMPVPGDRRYEWDGFMPSDAHPRELNPARGWVGSANHMNLPPDFDHARHKPGFEFATGNRFRRITEVLESRPRHGLDDMAALQAGRESLVARQVDLPRGDQCEHEPRQGGKGSLPEFLPHVAAESTMSGVEGSSPREPTRRGNVRSESRAA